jgi:hypothetical protein
MSTHTLGRIADLLNDAMSRIGPVEVYVFGSALCEEASANDVDLLVLYDTDQQPPLVREALASIDGAPPLHLTFMLPQEEKETAFISAQECRLLSQCIPRKACQ